MNELATISSRQFNVEEVHRYSGGRNDVSRLAANFAGVATNNDSRNDIVIRGNSPTGLEAMIEGPLSKKANSNGQNGSFVVAYRHSFVELAQKAGINVGTAALPRYKDLTFNVDLGQTKAGKFSLFGIGALSNIDFIGEQLSEDDFFADKSEDSYADSKLGIIGLRHNIIIDNNTYIRTVLS